MQRVFLYTEYKNILQKLTSEKILILSKCSKTKTKKQNFNIVLYD